MNEEATSQMRNWDPDWGSVMKRDLKQKLNIESMMDLLQGRRMEGSNVITFFGWRDCPDGDLASLGKRWE